MEIRSQSYPDRWVVEMAIPFRSLRYFEGVNEWGINFGRLDLKTNEKSAWAPVPRQFPHNSLPYAGTLVWDKPPEKAGLRMSFIPYAHRKSPGILKPVILQNGNGMQGLTPK
jgi:hypothetical protein